MNNIPLFTCESGVASLTLQEIPYSKKAYVRIQSSEYPETLIKECASFCQACGAEHCFATDSTALDGRYPRVNTILKMIRSLAGIEDTDAALWPVQEQTLDQWRKIYNERMAGVPMAAYLSKQSRMKILQDGDGYFIHRGEKLLGIGKASGEKIDVVAACVPGAGRDIVLALCHGLSGEQAELEVSSDNHRAIRLYERLGFFAAGEVERWYKIF